MSAYFTIKSILVVLGLVGSFGCFFIQSRRLIHLMTTVSGRKNFPVDRLSQRLKILFKEVLLQSSVREKPFPGLAHTLIFFGFIAVLPHTIELMIAGIFPGLLITAVLVIFIYVMCRTNPTLGPRGPRSSWKERGGSLKAAGPIVILFMVVIGGMYGGIFTACEAGGIGAVGTVIIGLIM